MVEVKKSNCHHCGYLCGVEVHVDERERIHNITPDPTRYPYDKKIVNRCRRFSALGEYLDHPDRINHPLKRIGKRGEGKWQRICWDEAMESIADGVKNMRDQYGPESLATSISAPHAIYWPLHRFMNVWGSPNNIGIGISCWNPRIWVNSLTFGWPIEDEILPNKTRCAILWGVNPAESDNSLFWKTVRDYIDSGGTLITVDPRQTSTSRMAGQWLSIRPGTDGALALGMLHVIVKEKLVDERFVHTWCSGFDDLTRRIDDYPLETVAAITGLAPSSITEAARVYATSPPASILTGLGIDMGGANCTQTLRAISILRAVTGNFDTPGANCLHDYPDFMPEVAMELGHLLSPEQRKKKLGRGLFGLQRYEGLERLDEYTRRHGKVLPTRYLTAAHPHLAWQAMITGQPYPIRGLITFASNPLLCQSDTRRIYGALCNLDLLVCLEHFLTPTAMLADYVLPMAGSLEQSMVQTNGGTANIAYGGPAAISPRHERRTGFDFWCDLGRRCGQTEHWPWKSLEEALDTIFSPCGLTWDQFCKTGLYAPEPVYHKYIAQGFATPSGKIELSSRILKDLGHDPLPAYTAVERDDDTYPLTLMSGVRRQPYYSSQHRQVASLRRRRLEPVAEMSASTASALGLAQGDWVWIETHKGRIRQRLKIADMRPDTVSIEYGWWFPERSSAAPELGGVWESNANVLTSAHTDRCDPILGQWGTRDLCCKVYKVKAKENPISIRYAVERDRDALIRLLWESEMEHAEPISDYRLALDGSDLLGCLRLEDHENLQMIRPVVVAQQHRQKGVGRRLIESISSGTKPIAVAARGEAVSFYRTLGFIETKWIVLPENQQEECCRCPDRSACKPQPMMRNSKNTIMRKEGTK